MTETNVLHNMHRPSRLGSIHRHPQEGSTLAAALLLLMLCSGWFLGLDARASTTLVGQWQASFEGNSHSRILLRLDSTDGGKLHGVVYLLDDDNAAWPHATSAFKSDGSELSFRIPNLDVSFAGKVGSDGALIGLWKQHGAAVPLRFIRAVKDIAWPVPLDDGKSMPATADPAFDVATIKLANPKDDGSGFQLRGVRLHVRNESLESIAAFAYGIHRGQFQGAPSWFATDRWEIDVLADTPGAPNLAQMRTMYRKLLTERFALKLDRQTRQLSVYLLEVAQDGPNLTHSLGNPNGPPDSTGNSNGGVHDVRYTDMTMDEFAQDLAFSEDRPVVNATKLAGRYDFRLKWSSPEAAAGLTPSADNVPVLFTAVREQLGLSLKATHAPADVYVISHVERPSAN